MQEAYDGNGHDGAGAAEPVRCVVGAQDYGDVAEEVARRLKGVGGWEVVWVAGFVEDGVELYRGLLCAGALGGDGEEVGQVREDEVFGADVEVVEEEEEVLELAA